MSGGVPNRGLLWRRILVVSALGTFAFVAPLLDLYGRNPEVFVANRASRGQIVAFAVLVTIFVPLLATFLLSLTHLRGTRVADLTFAVLITLAAFGGGLAVSRQLVPDSDLGAVLSAVAVGLLLLAFYRVAPGVIRLSALALPVVLGLFLFSSDTSRLIWEQPDEPASSHSVGHPAPVVLVVFDEFPTASLMNLDGAINRSLFPNFARVADTATWYRNAFSNSIATTQSLPAILTGRLGDRQLSPTFTDHPENLFTLLDGVYEMHVIEWVTELCPEDICPDPLARAPARFASLFQDMWVVYGHLTLPPTARSGLPSIDNAWSGFLGQDAAVAGTRVDIDGLPVPGPEERSDWVDWMQRIVDGMYPGAPPTLRYVHLRAPHVPWQINPSGTQYQRPEAYTEVEGVGGDGRWTAVGPGPALLGYQRYLYQLGFVDTMLGRLVDRMEETGMWDEAMLILVADHGASFEPGEHRRWPFENNRDDLYRVPMIVKYPGQTEGEIVDEPGFGIDIVPTIVDVLGIETEWEFDGISLLDVWGTDRPHQPISWCCNDEPVETDISILFEQVRRFHQRIPDQSSWLGVAGAGPYAELLGQDVAALDVTPSESLRWALDDESSLEVDPGSGMVQTLIQGRVELPPGVEAEQVLLALNGQVAGTGFVSRDTPEGGRLTGLVAEELMTAGTNTLDILVRVGNQWLAGDAAPVTLELITDDGRTLEIAAQGAKRLEVNRVDETETGWLVEGWAADVVAKTPPDQIYLFAGAVLLVAEPPNRDNRNVVAWFDSDDLLRSGFSFEVDAALLPDALENLTVVAEFDGYAISNPAWLAGQAD